MRPDYTYVRKARRKTDEQKLDDYFRKVLDCASVSPLFDNAEYEIAKNAFYENLKTLISKS